MMRFGDFEILGSLGKGGLARVYRARPLSGRHKGAQVALKLMRPELAADPELVEMFRDEADMMRYLDHPAVIETLETGQAEDTFYIAMELVEGCDLGRVLEACRETSVYFPADIACHVAATVADALDYAHNARRPDGTDIGVVHCDVTPSNIFISNYGDIRLGDFGVARARAHQRQDGVFAGKPGYLAPEQILGEPVTAATDVFALGAVLYELLTNRPAFSASSVDAVFDAIVRGRVTPPRKLRRDLSPELNRVVLRALAPLQPRHSLWGRQPKPRYRSARAFADALTPLFDPAVGTPLAVGAVMRTVMPETWKG